MNTLTKKELLQLGGIIIADTGILDGEIFHHHKNDYQAGAGNHGDYKLFVTVETDKREPFLGGVNYFLNGNLVIMKEYPQDMVETGADKALRKGGLFAASQGVFIITYDFLDLD